MNAHMTRRLAVAAGLALFALVAPVGGSGQPSAVDPVASAPVGPFEQRLELNGISFQVTSPNKPSDNRVRIAPPGLTIDNSPIDWEALGMVIGAQVADMNADRSPQNAGILSVGQKPLRGARVAVVTSLRHGRTCLRCARRQPCHVYPRVARPAAVAAVAVGTTSAPIAPLSLVFRGFPT